MSSSDLIMMIGNLSQSMFSVQRLVSGLAYIIGILFFMTAIAKLKKIGDHRVNSSSHEKMFVPLAFTLGGAALLFLPSAFVTLTNTVFGAGNILSYASYNPYDVTSAMGLIIQTAGLLWFVRGCVLLVHSSEPGVQHGPKGLAFLCGGILAMNFHATVSATNAIIQKITTFTTTVTTSQGY